MPIRRWFPTAPAAHGGRSCSRVHRSGTGQAGARTAPPTDSTIIRSSMSKHNCNATHTQCGTAAPAMVRRCMNKLNYSTPSASATLLMITKRAGPVCGVPHEFVVAQKVKPLPTARMLLMWSKRAGNCAIAFACEPFFGCWLHFAKLRLQDTEMVARMQCVSRMLLIKREYRDDTHTSVAGRRRSAFQAPT